MQQECKVHLDLSI